MKNKLLISLLLIVSSYLTYSLFFKSPEISNTSSKNNSVLSNDTSTFNAPIQQSQKIKESTFTVEETTYKVSNNSSAVSNNTPTSSTNIQQSPKTKENASTALDSNTSSTANLDTKTITVPNFLSSLKCTNYVLKSGETLTQIARKYQNTCNLSTSIKLIKYINKINDGDNLNSGVILSIPESILTTGTMYPVTTGDTWYSIAKKHYNTYDVSSITKLLVYINDLPNNDLPLGESIFLPLI